MNFKENWWKFLILFLVVVGLIWWRGRTTPTDDEGLLNEDEQLEQQVNDFLEESGIELPETGERANLRDVEEAGSTGAATRENQEEGGQTYTIVAALPDLESGWYEGWLLNEDNNEYVDMGRLRMAKGGFLLNYESGESLEAFDKIVVSRENEGVSEPTQVVLEGDFKPSQETTELDQEE